MVPITYHNVLDMAQQLSAAERLQLLEAVAKTLREELQPPVEHRLSDLKGLGKDLWQTINVEQYVREERETWDG